MAFALLCQTRGPALAAALLFLALLAPLPALAADGPLHALKQAQAGIDECDSDRVNRAIDVASVVNNASDALVAALRTQATEGNLGNSNLVMAIALLGAAEDSGQAGILRSLLLSEVKGFVAAGVNGGYFAGEPNGKVKPSGGSLASVLNKMPQGRRVIRPGKVLSEKDGKATVSAVFIDPEAGEFPLTLGMEQEGGNWRVKEIANAKALFEDAAKRGRK